jgi:hypothetical protein
MSDRRAVFLINLLQDVNVLRPLIHMAARDLGLRVDLLVSHVFSQRDIQGQWRAELAEISRDALAPIRHYASPWEAFALLQGKAGVLVSASESNLSTHRHTHDVFRIAPPDFVRITLQHGFECVGFRQSRDHDLAHGRSVTFAADVVCSWVPAKRLTHLAPSQAGKLWVTGPTAVLQTRPLRGRETPLRGIVCENLHSVRLNVAGDFKSAFMEVFDAFSRVLKERNRPITLRPHPGGQYVLKNDVPLAPNVTLNVNPMYRLDLSRFAYGLSAPSSVLIDMALAGVPTAVWRDVDGVMDADAYAGFETVTTHPDWLAFVDHAESDPEIYRSRQKAFLEREELVTDPAITHRRFAELLQGSGRIATSTWRAPRRRVLFVSNDHIPTLQLSFETPLASVVARGEIEAAYLNETAMGKALGRGAAASAREEFLNDLFFSFRPTLVVFCRYSGPGVDVMLDLARRLGAATILHLDDDMLNVPEAIGAEKAAFHNRPERLASMRRLLEDAHLVYSSTPRLRETLGAQTMRDHIVNGDIYCASGVLRPAEERVVRRVGYMGFGHAQDFALVADAVAEFLRRNEAVAFELFGTIPEHPALSPFGDRITVRPPVRNYNDFLVALADLRWDIGICPLERNPFNLNKANTKWVEYTAVGAAVVASADTIYDEVCGEGCGVLARTRDEWVAGLESLCDPAARHAQVVRAQDRLRRLYNPERLTAQVLSMMDRAETIAAERAVASARVAAQ